VTPAKTFDCPLDPYAHLRHLHGDPGFADAHPSKQLDTK
jgi:hypothetical protein